MNYRNMLNPKQISDFNSNVLKGQQDVCWPYQGHITEFGYGRVGISGENEMAHRIAYGLNYGEIPEGLFVLHECDNRRCCNPAHLFLGTREENNTDRDAKGRHVVLRGEQIGNSKLTAEQVKQIRFWYALGGYTQAALARRFNLERSCISALVTRKNWRHI